MKKPPGISDEDRALFQEAVKNIKPLKKSQKISVEKPKPIQKRKKPEVLMASHKVQLYDAPETHFQAEDYLTFSQSGLQQKRLRDLACGKFFIEADLDLHAKTIAQAKRLLEEFLTKAIAKHFRVVRIIHGKGIEAILKNKVYGWLSDCREVLAFCSCQAKDGGTGALYVLLKAK